MEERVHPRLLEIGPAEFEAEKIPFTQPPTPPKARYYLPDFKIAENTFIETKGRLTLEDRKKMLWVKEQNPHVTVYFIFQRADDKLDKRSKTTKRQWAEKNGFECIDEGEPIPKKWFSNLNIQSKRLRRRLSE